MIYVTRNFFRRPETFYQSRNDLSTKFSGLILLKVIALASQYLRPFYFLNKKQFYYCFKKHGQVSSFLYYFTENSGKGKSEYQLPSDRISTAHSSKIMLKKSFLLILLEINPNKIKLSQIIVRKGTLFRRVEVKPLLVICISLNY